MKTLIAMSLLFSAYAHAGISETTIHCTTNSKGTCTQRTLNAFKKLGCSPVVNSVKCFTPQNDPRHVYSDTKNFEFCYIDSECSDPGIHHMFGTLDCNGDRLNRSNSVNLKTVDSKLDLGVSVGLFRRPVTKLCIDRK